MSVKKDLIPLYWWDTVYNADSVEWCPDSEFNNLLLCGTYKLDEDVEKDNNSPQRRVGLLHLLKLESTASGVTLIKEETLDTAAILDIKWAPHRIQDKVLFAIADALGVVSIYQVSEKAEVYSILPLVNCNITAENENIALSLDWSVQTESLLVVSDSIGRISVLNLNNGGLSIISQWKAHEYEAWIVAFDYYNDSVVYTGGDDTKLCVFDTRNLKQPNAICCKQVHNAGVTSLHCGSENILASGSYDESVLLWDTRQMKRNIGGVYSIGGGVWRLKWCPNYESSTIRKGYLLAACMHAGFRIINCQDNYQNPTIETEFSGEHKSLAYGADWCYIPSSNVSKLLNKDSSKDSVILDKKLIATCSFYDNKLCLSVTNMSLTV